MTLKDGLYHIHYSPAPDLIGGMYATGGQVETSVRAAALRPGVGLQTWLIQHADEGYTISNPGLDPHPPLEPGPVLPGWGRMTEAENEPVLYTVRNLKNWIIAPIEDGAPEGKEIYSIRAPTRLKIRLIFYVNIDNETLALKAYPVTEEMPPAPRWQLLYNGLPPM
ncbi:unnamed protein product [Cyclocybe aegerita]|uniref:Uncharacterized protein n=1 Tax=Cyclocybe aegerita TaxID=1973307 RepID=A0A8S0WRJ1_CYCAE|nr:unnamed protein product [Cyclocybe aegerita]